MKVDCLQLQGVYPFLDDNPAGHGSPSPAQYPMLHSGVGPRWYTTIPSPLLSTPWELLQLRTWMGSSDTQHSLPLLMHPVAETMPSDAAGTSPEIKNSVSL